MITPQLIYEGSYGMELVFTIGQPLSADSTYSLYISGPSSSTTYTFSSATDFQDDHKGVLAYIAQVGDFPVKGNYKFQLSMSRTSPEPQLIYSSVLTVPVHDSIVVGEG